MGSRAKERVLHAAHNDASLIGSLTAESGCPPVPQTVGYRNIQAIDAGRRRWAARHRGGWHQSLRRRCVHWVRSTRVRAIGGEVGPRFEAQRRIIARVAAEDLGDNRSLPGRAGSAHRRQHASARGAQGHLSGFSGQDRCMPLPTKPAGHRMVGRHRVPARLSIAFTAATAARPSSGSARYLRSSAPPGRRSGRAFGYTLIRHAIRRSRPCRPGLTTRRLA